MVHAARLYGVRKLLYLGSSCIYPRDCPQPMKEEYLLSGTLEPTNEPYAIAKIADIKLCQAYRRQYGCRFVGTLRGHPADVRVVPRARASEIGTQSSATRRE